MEPTVPKIPGGIHGNEVGRPSPCREREKRKEKREKRKAKAKRNEKTKRNVEKVVLNKNID
jgi:hypothetical protein